MIEVVIAGYLRSPFTPANKGGLSKVRPDELAATVIRVMLERAGVKPETVEDVILGCAFPEGEQGLNMARLVALLAGLPNDVAGQTINRFCGSSMQSIHAAAGAIHMQAGDAFVCAGVESMTRVPIMGFNPLPSPTLNASCPAAYMSMGETAENVAKKYGIGRAEQEAFAVGSHQKAYAAQQRSDFQDEIVPIDYGGTVVGEDGCVRADTSTQALSELRPAFDEQGSVTAGTSSPLTDGAAATLVCSGEYADRHGLPRLAVVRSTAVAGCAPEIMGIGPVAATRKALRRARLDVGDLDIIELNEAFAAQALACIKELELPEERINLDGGAIALGHPLGATGARITGKAAQLLQREDKRFALATQCIGGGQGIATILERPA